MFQYNQHTRTYWFKLTTIEADVEFRLVGMVLGLAIYNGVILDVHFPLVVYKKLLGRPTDFLVIVQQIMLECGDAGFLYCRDQFWSLSMPAHSIDCGADDQQRLLCLCQGISSMSVSN